LARWVRRDTGGTARALTRVSGTIASGPVTLPHDRASRQSLAGGKPRSCLTNATAVLTPSTSRSNVLTHVGALWRLTVERDCRSPITGENGFHQGLHIGSRSRRPAIID
jgi:hypothetical protein